MVGSALDLENADVRLAMGVDTVIKVLPVSCEGGCQNGGECISVNGVVKCLCASGWTGSRCQEAICPQGCRNNGACVAPGICSCPAGWVGGACHLAVCKLPCQHGGKCIAPNVCRCRLPYSGLQCTKKRKE
ncbi:von Willebrand factor D and EGF domain-containing protein-like [Columba guinea]|nr:von Willebrand factor D and EGF domain-containing protein-like [Columba guinea]